MGRKPSVYPKAAEEYRTTTRRRRRIQRRCDTNRRCDHTSGRVPAIGPFDLPEAGRQQFHTTRPAWCAPGRFLFQECLEFGPACATARCRRRQSVLISEAAFVVSPAGGTTNSERPCQLPGYAAPDNLPRGGHRTARGHAGEKKLPCGVRWEGRIATLYGTLSSPEQRTTNSAK